MRQRPMTAGGTIFLTLEDETGYVNVIIWRRLWECQRSIILNTSLLAVDGVMESDGEVYHLIARQVHDFDHLVQGLKTRLIQGSDSNATHINQTSYFIMCI